MITSRAGKEARTAIPILPSQPSGLTIGSSAWPATPRKLPSIKRLRSRLMESSNWAIESALLSGASRNASSSVNDLSTVAWLSGK